MWREGIEGVNSHGPGWEFKIVADFVFFLNQGGPNKIMRFFEGQHLNIVKHNNNLIVFYMKNEK